MDPSPSVVVRVVDLNRGSASQINDRAATSLLAERQDEIESAIHQVATILQSSAKQENRGSGITEMEATFSLTFGVEAGILISKMSAEASLEVKMKMAFRE